MNLPNTCMRLYLWFSVFSQLLKPITVKSRILSSTYSAVMNSLSHTHKHMYTFILLCKNFVYMPVSAYIVTSSWHKHTYPLTCTPKSFIQFFLNYLSDAAYSCYCFLNKSSTLLLKIDDLVVCNLPCLFPYAFIFTCKRWNIDLSRRNQLRTLKISIG